jgi:hypothetical protein
MPFVVCLDVGMFDIKIDRTEFDSQLTASLFLDQIQPHCKYELQVKSDEEIRTPVCEFILDHICLKIEV